jgi:putative ABC transport system permease protein
VEGAVVQADASSQEGSLSMRLTTLILRESFERKSQFLSTFVAILLGIAAIVAIQNTTFYSEKAVARELDALGANILVLPKTASVQDYYRADLQDDEFSEEYVKRLTSSELQGLDNLSPKLSYPVEISGKHFTLTGIMPRNEFAAKAAWQGAGIFSRPEGCGTVAEIPGLKPPSAQETLVRKRVIDTLDENQALIGAEVAEALKLSEGKPLSLLGRKFSVAAVLPQTGTIDDSRIFVNLHEAQKMAGKGNVVNIIEVVGCCQQISKGLVQKINALLPEAKVVTIRQVVDTQVKTNQVMSQLSLVFLLIIALVGGASIANYMYANVYERQREIGTLMALGAGSGTVLRMFLLKATMLGFFGGLGGYLLGTVLALVIGPQIAGIPVLPMPSLLPVALVIAVVVSLVASYFPARSASRLDPSVALRES